MEKRKRKKHPSLVAAGSVGVTSTTGCDGSSGKDARSVLGRALIIILVSASLASEALTHNEPNTTSEYDPVMEDMINTMVMDGSRVSIRRWASMVFVWMYGGQSKGLDIVRNVLSHGEGGTTAHRHWWDDVITTTITPTSTFYSSYNNHNFPRSRWFACGLLLVVVVVCFASH